MGKVNDTDPFNLPVPSIKPVPSLRDPSTIAAALLPVRSALLSPGDEPRRGSGIGVRDISLFSLPCFQKSCTDRYLFGFYCKLE
jgi:hypothetical protein